VRPHNGFEVRLSRFYVEFADVRLGSRWFTFWLPHGQNNPAGSSYGFAQVRRRLLSSITVVVKIVVKFPKGLRLPVLIPRRA
jgi:hypothetical protein